MNIYKTFLLIVFYLITSLSFGQDVSEKRISELIDNLNWNSVTITCNYDLVLTQSDSISNELVSIGKPVASQVLNALKTPEKSVASHIILTRIYEDTDKRMEGIETKYIHKNCRESVGWHHLYNGITWEWTSENGSSITQNQIDLALDYWNKKLILKENQEMPNSTEIFKRLEKEDNTKYPCNKVYINNSEEIKFKELKKVIGLRAKDKHLLKLMRKLGNDTIINNFKDSYFIGNGPDGIQFKFKSNDSLIGIFVTEEYKGTMWSNIKFNYNKAQIKRKLPIPDELKNGGGDQEIFWYREPNLEIFFNSDDSIKHILILK